MNKCPVSGCGLFHERMMNCKVARNQLAAGTLAEPWKSANKLQEIVDRKIEPVVRTVPKAAPQEKIEAPMQAAITSMLVAAPCPVCEARRLKNLESVRKYRKKALVTNTQK